MFFYSKVHLKAISPACFYVKLVSISMCFLTQLKQISSGELEIGNCLHFSASTSFYFYGSYPIPLSPHLHFCIDRVSLNMKSHSQPRRLWKSVCTVNSRCNRCTKIINMIGLSTVCPYLSLMQVWKWKQRCRLVAGMILSVSPRDRLVSCPGQGVYCLSPSACWDRFQQSYDPG